MGRFQLYSIKVIKKIERNLASIMSLTESLLALRAEIGGKHICNKIAALLAVLFNLETGSEHTNSLIDLCEVASGPFIGR